MEELGKRRENRRRGDGEIMTQRRRGQRDEETKRRDNETHGVGIGGAEKRVIQSSDQIFFIFLFNYSSVL
jgi:hypothetical protein